MKKTRDEIQAGITSSILEHDFNCLIEVTQRTGKTKLVIDALKQLEPGNILWVTNEKDLAEVKLPQEFRDWGAKHLLPNTTFMHWRSLGREKNTYKYIVLDEIQAITELSYEYFNTHSCSHILGMTGQLPEAKEKKELIKQGLQLPLVYRYSKDEAVKDKVIADYKINVIQIPLSTVKNLKVVTKKVTYMTSELKRYTGITAAIDRAKEEQNWKLMQNLSIARQRFLHSMPSKVTYCRDLLANKQDEKLLIFCPTKAVTQEVCNTYFHSSGGKKNYDLFQEDKLNHLSVVNKVSTGHTFHNMNGSIMMGLDNNQNGNLSQKAARCMVFREGYKAELYFLVAKNTQEEDVWLPKTLASFNKSKIHYYEDTTLI